MRARVNSDCPWAIVTAFGGREYVKNEWRAMPAGVTSEHDWLDFESDPVDFPDAESEQSDYTGMTVVELRELAQGAEIEGYYRLRKDELIAALEGVDNGDN